MKFVNYKDLYEMVVNHFEGLEDDEIIWVITHRNERDPILKQFDSYLTVGEHEKAKKRYRYCRYCGPRKFKEDLVVFHGDGCLWDSVKRPNVEMPTIRVEPGFKLTGYVDIRKGQKEYFEQPSLEVGVDENLELSWDIDCLEDTAIDSMEGEELRRFMSLGVVKCEDRRDDLAAMCTTIDDIISIPHMATADEIATIEKEECCRQAPLDFYAEVRPNEESTHSEKEVEEKPLKDEKETKTNDEKFSSLEKFGLATNWASAMTMANARDFLQKVSNALRDMNEKLKQEVKLEPAEEPKKDILKVKCVGKKPSTFMEHFITKYFTVDKVYERVNGVLTDDGGTKWVCSCRGDDPTKWKIDGVKFELAE